MRVNGTGNTPRSADAGRGVDHRRGPEGASVQVSSEVGAPESAKLRPAHGVLRLLQEGHFKGVADVRLRINFAEEIAALQADATGESAASVADTVLDPVNSVLEEFLAQDGLDEALKGKIQDAAQAFREAVNGFFSAFDPAVDPRGSDLASAIEDAFQAFVDALKSLAPEDDAQEDPAVFAVQDTVSVLEADTPAPAELAYGDFILKIEEAFASAISDLRDSFQSAQILPELSGPTGNGGAYAKFLEILNGLSGDGDRASSGVDTAA